MPINSYSFSLLPQRLMIMIALLSNLHTVLGRIWLMGWLSATSVIKDLLIFLSLLLKLGEDKGVCVGEETLGDREPPTISLWWSTELGGEKLPTNAVMFLSFLLFFLRNNGLFINSLKTASHKKHNDSRPIISISCISSQYSPSKLPRTPRWANG